MKFSIPLLAAFTVCFIVSCSGDKPAKLSLEKKNKKIEYALLPENIYRSNSIQAAVEQASEPQKNESRRLFMSGLDLLANKSDARASVEYFKEAIYYYPDEKNYSYLFQAYLKLGEAALADSVNYALMGKIPVDQVSFNMALVEALRHDTADCLSSLDAAVMEGFVFSDRIVNEPLFDFLKDNQAYQAFMVTNFGNNEHMRQRLFKAFAKSFPDLELPHDMPQDSAQKFNFDQYIHYDFAVFIPGMNEGRFARDVSQEYMAVGKFRLENGMAFVFKTYDVIADTLNPVYTNLVIYDTLGVMLSNTPIGCFCSPLEKKGFVINKDLSIDVKSYKTTWEFDPLEKGYAGNRILSSEMSDKFRYVIRSGNKLTEEKGGDVASSGK